MPDAAIIEFGNNAASRLSRYDGSVQELHQFCDFTGSTGEHGATTCPNDRSLRLKHSFDGRSQFRLGWSGGKLRGRRNGWRRYQGRLEIDGHLNADGPGRSGCGCGNRLAESCWRLFRTPYTI